MWLQGLPLVVLLICSSSRSQKPMTDDEKAIQWLTELYNNASQEGNGPTTKGPTTKGIINRFTDTSTKMPDLQPNTKARFCFTDDQEEGVCAKTSECDKEAPKLDASTDFIIRQGSGCYFLEICCPADRVRKTPKKPEPLSEQGCGYSNPGANVFREKTSNSGYADFGEFPWIVALLKAGTDVWADENYLGGGTIIHPSVVMTAAHKVDNLEPSDLKCRAGEWDTQTDKEAYPHQDRAVAKIIVHEDLIRKHLRNNIALLILKEPFDKAPAVGVACLSLEVPRPGTVCYSMGWGADLVKSTKYANLLKKLKMPLVAPDDCQTRYRNSTLGPTYTLHRSLTCAGGEAMVDTCEGDGGSPLVCPVGKPAELRYAVVGMVAYGLKCGTPNMPGVYVKVPEFYDWVGTQMTREGFNRSSYERDTSADIVFKSSQS